MPATANYLALDLGASSGRAMLGTFDGQRLKIEELHRFPNGPLRSGAGYYWNVAQLFDEIRRALAICGSRRIRLDGIGIDTWGVDYGLLSAGGELLDRPQAPARIREPAAAAVTKDGELFYTGFDR
ncbi:MAG TPA: hypothetical protein VGM03_06415 [Phycisphaerae bacterium]|jgi:rhamnulokinase